MRKGELVIWERGMDGRVGRRRRGREREKPHNIMSDKEKEEL